MLPLGSGKHRETLLELLTIKLLRPHNDLVDGPHLHDVLELFVHVPQSELTCTSNTEGGLLFTVM